MTNFTEQELDDIGVVLVETTHGLANLYDERRPDRIQWARNMIAALELNGFRLVRAVESVPVDLGFDHVLTPLTDEQIARMKTSLELTPRAFKKRLDDLILGLAFLSGVPLPHYGGAFEHWGNKPPDPWAALRRAARTFS